MAAVAYPETFQQRDWWVLNLSLEKKIKQKIYQQLGFIQINFLNYVWSPHPQPLEAHKKVSYRRKGLRKYYDISILGLTTT